MYLRKPTQAILVSFRTTPLAFGERYTNTKLTLKVFTEPGVAFFAYGVATPTYYNF